MNMQTLLISKIEKDTSQPRKNIDKESVTELAQSIKEMGLFHPITVRPLTNGNYKIVLGNRRYEAFLQLGLEEIPCIVTDIEDDLEIKLIQFSENIQRKDLSALEEAYFFQTLLNSPKYRLSIYYLSQRIGLTELYIKKRLEIINFSEQVRNILHDGKEIVPERINIDQTYALRNVDSLYKNQLAFKVAREQISVNDTKKISEVFNNKQISAQTKENLLVSDSKNIIETWSFLAQNNKKNADKYTKPIIVDNTYKPEDESPQYQLSEIELLLNELISKTPIYSPYSKSQLQTCYQIPLDRKSEFISNLDFLIEKLDSHIKQWTTIKKNFTKNIRLVE